MKTVADLINSGFALVYLGGGLVAIALLGWYGLKGVIRNWGVRWRSGEACPVCGKPLELGRGRSVLTLGRPVPWLRCTGWPKCDFSTRRVTTLPKAANENARQAFRPPGAGSIQ
jgi:hypothetical protein